MRRAVPFIVLLFAIALPLVMRSLDQVYYVTMASRILIYALAATSLNLLLRCIGDPCGVGLPAFAPRQRAFRPRDPGDPRERDAHGGDWLPRVSLQAHRLCARRCARRSSWRAARQPEQLRQPRDPALDR